MRRNWLRSCVPKRIGGQMFGTDARGPYSAIEKLSIRLAACSANLSTLPE